MNFKVITASIFSLILLVGVGQTQEVYADEGPRTIESVSKDVSNVEKEIIEKVAKVDSINKEIQRIQSAIEANNKKVSTKEKDIKKINEDIAKFKEEIEKLESGIEVRGEIIDKRLQAIQLDGGQGSYLDVVLGSTSFDDFISRLYAVQTIMEADNELMSEQVKAAEEIEKSKASISIKLKKSEKAKNSLVEINKESESKKKRLANTKEEVSKEKKTLDTKKAAYVKEGNDIKELEKKTKLALEEKEKKELALAEKKAADKKISDEIAKADVVTASEKKKEVSKAQAQEKTVKETATPKADTSEPSSSGVTMTMSATAYTADCYGCSGITATGINLNNNRNLKVIAVDPRVIPLGSKVWVSGYGEAIAGDTGGAIKGNKIDLHFPNKSSALAFGRKNVTVKILD